MSILGRDGLNQFRAVTTRDVQVGEGEQFVRLRCPTIGERGKLEEMASGKKLAELRTYVLAYMLADENGQRMFNPLDAADRDAIGALNGDVMGKVFDEAIAFMGWTKKDREEIEKN